jgi:WD40 repeat protein
MGNSIWCVGISPDGSLLAAAGEHGLTLWPRDVPRGTRLVDSNVYSFSFSPDSRLLIWDHALLHVRDCARGTQFSFTVEDAQTGHFPFLSDSRRVLMVKHNHEIIVVDVVAKQPVFTLGLLDLGEQSSFFMGRSMSVSADGTWLAVQAPSIPIWDVPERRLLFSLPREPSMPNYLAWGRNRDLLAVGSLDGGLVVWNIPALRVPLARLGLDW